MRPSQVLNLTNDYEAFCFDEACTFIINKLEEKEEPWFDDSEEQKNNDNIIDFFNENNQKLL